MLGNKIKSKLDKNLKKQSIPEETINHLLIMFLTFTMYVVPPLIVAVISHFTVVYEAFDNISYLWISGLYWLITVLTYPQNGVFHIVTFGSFCMVYIYIAITVFPKL